MNEGVERYARAIANAPDPQRREAWLTFIDQSRAAASTTRERELALDLNARVTTRVRELCELRKARAPWNIPPAQPASTTVT